MTTMDRAIPSWVRNWLLVSSVICIMDGSFCVLRPHSLPGGCLEILFFPYKYYIAWDKHYGDATDSFVWAQGLGNIIESIINLVVYFNVLKSVRATKLLAIIVSVMVVWKTVIFDLYSFDVGTGGHTFDFMSEFMVFVPSLIWILVPGYVAFALCEDFLPPRQQKTPNRKAANNSSTANGEDTPKSRYALREKRN
ncbi:uncharacterized protein LOC127876897 [Dreissena polymorpha]|uniref:Uncharacterized protein n=1 Tax=Dreissena polymorpha TaxID=45954 RepID=A0A9D4QUM6_DREPO|nr:uncharacterized protein LOC127876897 [Dreissena polymorpha]KAH3843332.1 hypothetical protein DPMN_116847 [Dreissena polymorpha]